MRITPKHRPKWSTVTIGLAVIAALAIAMPAFGVSSAIKKAIKKEVAKQVKAGPAGAPGAPGAAGAPGAPKAFGSITYASDTPTIVTARSEGLTAVSETTTGVSAGADGFVCLDVAVPFKTGVVTPTFEAGLDLPILGLQIPATPDPPFSVGCPATSDLIVFVTDENGASFEKGSFTIALF